MVVTYDKKKHEAAEKALSSLLIHVGENGGKPIKVQFEGRSVNFSSRIESQYRKELKNILKEHGKKKGKKRLGEEGSSGVISEIYSRIENGIDNSFQMSPTLRKMVLERTLPLLKRISGISKRSFMPTPITFLDDAFVRFFESVKLDLLQDSFANESGAIRSEISGLNEEIIDFMIKYRVCASTVLHAILSHYITMKGLRNNGDMNKGTIKLDKPLEDLYRAPMSSLWEGTSLARYYESSCKKSKDDREKLSDYRVEYPQKSALDFSLSKSDGKSRDAYDKGMMLGQSLLIVINSHLISSRTLVSAGVFTPEQIESADYSSYLLTIQVFIKLTNDKLGEVCDAPPESSTLVSPSRSTSRTSQLKSESRSPSRSPRRSPSRR